MNILREKIVGIVGKCIDNDCSMPISCRDCQLEQADKILAIMKEILPEKKPLIMDSGKPLECGDNDIRLAINDLIDEILKRLEE